MIQSDRSVLPTKIQHINLNNKYYFLISIGSSDCSWKAKDVEFNTDTLIIARVLIFSGLVFSFISPLLVLFYLFSPFLIFLTLFCYAVYFFSWIFFYFFSITPTFISFFSMDSTPLLFSPPFSFFHLSPSLATLFF